MYFFLIGSLSKRSTYVCSWRFKPHELGVERVNRYKSGDKKTVRSRVEDSAVDYWAVHVGGAKNNNKHFYTMIERKCLLKVTTPIEYKKYMVSTNVE